MEYYFAESHYDVAGYSKATQLKYLKQHSQKRLKQVQDDLEQALNLSLEIAWVSRATFGSVFVDHEPINTGPALLGAHKRLFQLINADVKYVVVCRTITRNFMYKNVNGDKILLLNVGAYQTFVRTFRDQDKRIKLFLFKLNREEEQVVNDWVLTKPTEEREQRVLQTEELLDHLAALNINSIEQFQAFRDRLSTSMGRKIVENVRMYQERLNKFKKMINQEHIHETELSNFLHQNIWILDFRYIPLKRERELKTKAGNVDIYVTKEELGIKTDIIMELKIPSKKIIKTYRNKPAISAAVGDALSQIIHYMETQKETNKTLSGLLILGKKKDPFIDILNQHLAKIKVKTYEEIAEDCQTVLDSLKRKAPLSAKHVAPEGA